MNIQNILLLIIKVILLLLVILIFSVVNTKDAHIAKMKKNEKFKRASKKIKEGMDHNPPQDISKVIVNENNMNNIIDNMVDKSRKLLEARIKEPGVNHDLINDSLNSLNRNTSEIVPEGFVENMSSMNDMARKRQEKRSKKTIFGSDDDDSPGNFAISSNTKINTSNKECKYESKKILSGIVWLLRKLLFVFIWLIKAMFNLIPEDKKRGPIAFFNILYFPFEIVLNLIKMGLSSLLSAIFGLKNTIVLIISTIANIAFVFVPNFAIDIFAYFFVPFLLLARRIRGLFSFIPTPPICWSK